LIESIAVAKYRHGNIRQQKRQLIMRTFVETIVIRDRDGYRVHDYGSPAPNPSATLAEQPESGIYIIGNSGTNEKVIISTEKKLRLWDKVRQLDSPHDVVNFMNRWGSFLDG
jgi:hypothetical protein